MEHPDRLEPDEETEDQKLVARTGDEHEQLILQTYARDSQVTIITKDDLAAAVAETRKAIDGRAPVIYQAALTYDAFAGFADFLVLTPSGQYQVWDTKLAHSPKPYFAVQLCCYADLLEASTGVRQADTFGIILGNQNTVEFRLEDYVHYYRRLRGRFLELQAAFTGDFAGRPEPLPSADHGRWNSHAEAFFEQHDHLVRVAGISAGQIKKLMRAGIGSMSELSHSASASVPKLPPDTLDKLASQARLQRDTVRDRQSDKGAPARFELLASVGPNAEPRGLALLPPPDPADVFFDMEGYPLYPGGLEYLFGVATLINQPGRYEYKDWWAHDRDSEKQAFEDFVDWVYARWKANPRMHIHHYASYEVAAISRLSTRHDTRQDEVDALLEEDVFVDLYRVVRQGLRIGEDSYSLKSIEHLYMGQRAGAVATAADSMVQYASWLGSGQGPKPVESPILKGIRDYNAEDCISTANLAVWLRKIAAEKSMAYGVKSKAAKADKRESPGQLRAARRYRVIAALRSRKDALSATFADLIDFHRREEKPMWWRMFDRAEAVADDLRDDPSCIEGLVATGTPSPDGNSSLTQQYSFDSSQECKLKAGPRSHVMFPHDTKTKFTLTALDLDQGRLSLKISKAKLLEKFSGKFPSQGSIIPDEFVPAVAMQEALTDLGEGHIQGKLPPSVRALLLREPPSAELLGPGETTESSAIRIARQMSGGCLVIQGPPGTGKTVTGAAMISDLVASGKKVGVLSNSHKSIVNLMKATGRAARKQGSKLIGVKAGYKDLDTLIVENPGVIVVGENKDALAEYSGGVVGGTAWLFALPGWRDQLDYLFIDEAGQFSLANGVATARAAKNLVLLGDQMQLEQPTLGSHPGDAGLSVLQYALKDLERSKPDAPIFHPVVPSDYGLFLEQSWRMHPSVCKFVSEIAYESRLGSHPDCDRQRVARSSKAGCRLSAEHGVWLVGVEHDGNTQQSDEEAQVVRQLYDEMIGREFTAFDGTTSDLALADFLFMSPYNAQVRSMQRLLPEGAMVGSVDKFQGQQAAVCILSLSSSFGEYGSRGLSFILDRNRMNVALSRAHCLSIVVADPRMATASARSISEMTVLNLFCKLAGNSILGGQ